MKTKKLLPGFTALFFIVMIFGACKKQESLQLPPAVNNAEVKNAMQKLRDAFQTAADWKKQNLRNYISIIDYGTSAVVSLGNAETLYLAKLTTTGKVKSNRFIAVRKTKETYSFDGIYEAKGLSVIIGLLKSNILPPTDSVHMRGLNNMPTKAWISKGGKVTPLIVKSIKRSKLKETMLRLSSRTPQLLLEDNGGGGGEEECTEYWYWIYDTEFDEWIPLYYLFTLCDGNNETGGGGEEEQPVSSSCMEEAQNAQATLAGIQTSEDIEETVVAAAADTAVILRKWKCVDGYIWSYISKEIGVTQRPDPDLPVWLWKTFSHNSIELVGMSFGGSMAVNTISVVALPTFYGSAAYMKLDFTVLYTPDSIECQSIKVKFPSFSVAYNPTSPIFYARGL